MGQTQTIGKTATTISTSGGNTRVTYHSTDVVTFNPDTIVLNTGGWRTVTTKARMNQASNQLGLGYGVYQRDYAWFVDYKGQTFEYAHRYLSINRSTGEVMGGNVESLLSPVMPIPAKA